MNTEVEILDSADALDITFEAQAKNPDGSLDPILRIVDIYTTAVNAGMFPAQRTTPEATALEVVADSSRQGVVRQQWRVRGVAVGAYRILLSMIAVSHQYQTPLSSLSLRSTVGRGSLLSLSDVTRYPFPMRTGPVEFKLRLPRFRDEMGNPRMRIEFAKDIEDEALDLFESWFTAWDHLITHGGYFHVADELELDDAVVLGETYMLSPSTVEHTFEGVVGSVEAFDAVINMAVRIHRTLHQVILFELE